MNITINSLIGLLLLFMLLQSHPHYAPDHASRARLYDLRRVARMIHTYAAEYAEGVYPTLEDCDVLIEALRDSNPNDTRLLTSMPSFIWICPVPWTDRRIPDDITHIELTRLPMLYENVDLDLKGTWVYFWDGQTKFLTNEEFEAIIDVEQAVCLACEFGTDNWLRKREP